MRKIVSMGAVAFVAIGIVQAGGKAANVPAADLKWAGAGAPGVSTAVVEGDMAKGPSHFYLKYAAGLATPVHHHTADHYVHLVSGSLVLVQGGGQEVKLAPGSYFEFTSKAPHAARCEGSADCVMFVDARGPWDVVPEKK